MEERKEPDAHLYDDAAALGSDGGWLAFITHPETSRDRVQSEEVLSLVPFKSLKGF